MKCTEVWYRDLQRDICCREHQSDITGQKEMKYNAIMNSMKRDALPTDFRTN